MVVILRPLTAATLSTYYVRKLSIFVEMTAADPLDHSVPPLCEKGLRLATKTQLDRDCVLMIVSRLSFPDMMLIEPMIFGDESGFHNGSLNRQAFEAANDSSVDPIQDNLGCSSKGLLSGLRFALAKNAAAKHLVNTGVFA